MYGNVKQCAITYKKWSCIKTIILIFFCLSSFQLMAQHENHPSKDTTESEMSMSHAFSLNLPMNRNASGTAWLPDSSAMYGHGKHIKRWMIMFHGNVFVRYNKQDITNEGSRGGEKFDVPNWFMLMGQKKN